MSEADSSNNHKTSNFIDISTADFSPPLEQALREYQEALASQEARMEAQEKLLLQQTAALKASQEQVTRLFTELESFHQVAQRQQILIEKLSQQLESSQERVAALEQESALIQQCYKEQSQKLLLSDRECRELQARLHRQQHQTLQFKAALDKHLETPAPQPSPNTQHHQKTAQSILPKVQPIQTWSATQDLPDSQTAYKDVPGTESEPKEEEIEEEIEPRDDDMPDLSWVFQLFEEPDDDEDESSDSDSASDSVDDEGSDSAKGDRQDSSLPEQDIAPQEFAVAADYVMASCASVETNVTDVTDGVDTPVEVDSAQHTSPLLPQSNWPSPLVYPLRPPKKRKSLAAIELPNFRRH